MNQNIPFRFSYESLEDVEIQEEEIIPLEWEFNGAESNHYEIYVDKILVMNITLNTNRIEYLFSRDSQENYTIIVISKNPQMS